MSHENTYENPIGIKWNGNFGLVQYGGDDRTIALFYKRPVHNAQKSRQHGLPIHDDVDFVRIQQPGERLNIIERPVNPNDKMRFPRQWAEYLANREQTIEGTPIDLLFPAHPYVGQNMRAMGVHTIEQCANLSDHAMAQIGMGAQDYVNLAKDYLEMANKGVGLHKFKAELEERDGKIRTLEMTIANLQAQLTALTSAFQSTGDTVLVPKGLIAQAQAVEEEPKLEEKKHMAPPKYYSGGRASGRGK